MVEMSDWSMLPCDILADIASKLDFIEDAVYFSVVCTSWHCAYRMIKNKFNTSVPWLLLPENTHENPKCLRKLYSINTRRCYKIKLPETFGARCWGASSGWVVTIDLTLELYMFNPFTGVRIRLPPQSTMPYKKEKKHDPYWFRRMYVDKAYVYDLCNDDFVVVVLHGGPLDAKIAYARPGDEAWTTLVITKPRSCVHDIVRLGTQLLAVFGDGMVGYCDMPTFQNSQPPIVIEKYLPMPSRDLEKTSIRRFYLLEYDGQLLFIHRYREFVMSKSHPNKCDEDVGYGTEGFDVYLFNFDTGTWKIVKDLGNISLFVGNNCSLAVNECAQNNLQRNCIYFTDDETVFWSLPKRYGGHDMGIYHLENKEIEKHYKGDDIRSVFCPAIWFVPKYFC